MTKATELFGRGQKIDYPPIQGEDELAQLSKAFAEMSASIEDLERNRAQYIAMIAHDIRNPLSTIKELFKTLQKGDYSPQEKEQSIQTVNIRLEQIQRMIYDLLEYSRLDLGRVVYDPDVVSVRFLLEEVVSGYPQHQNKLPLLSFSESICVWADIFRLQQIIGNIIDNGIKYTPAEARVTFGCRLDGNQVKIEITDGGKGIPAEVLKNLFEPFHSGPNHHHSGFGLGLAIAKKLAMGMNGDLQVNTKIGEGTTFIINLPQAVF